MKKMRPLDEQEARTEVGRLGKEYAIKYPKKEKDKAIKRLIGKASWFD